MTARSITIVGIGVIGASLARALGARGWDVRAVSPDPAEREAAAALGLAATDVDEESLSGAVGDASIIVLAVPLIAMHVMGPRVAAAASSDALILHTCSLLAPAALGLDARLAPRFLGTHPFAGSHDAGFAASSSTLFERCTVAVEERSTPLERRRLEVMWRDAGAHRFVYMDGQAHDRAVAWTSHLPQLAATALAATIAGAGGDTQLSGPGVRDTTRLAMSPFRMWGPILGTSPAEAVRALAALERTIHELREAVEASDAARVRSIWQRGSVWRRELGG